MYCYGEATRLSVRHMPVKSIKHIPSTSLKKETKKVKTENILPKRLDPNDDPLPEQLCEHGIGGWRGQSRPHVIIADSGLLKDDMRRRRHSSSKPPSLAAICQMWSSKKIQDSLIRKWRSHSEKSDGGD